MISLGIVLVLLLGEIDLSVGSVSGLAAAIMAVLVVNHGQSMWLACWPASWPASRSACFYAALYIRVGVPSFVITLAGLLGFQGLLLYVLGKNGTINLPRDSRPGRVRPLQVRRRRAVLCAGRRDRRWLYVVAQLWASAPRRRRRAQRPVAAAGDGEAAAARPPGCCFLTYYLGIDRGLGLPVAVLRRAGRRDGPVLRKTSWGRHLFAVGGNEEAARRSGIKVGRIYIWCSSCARRFAAVGGLLAAGQQTSVSQASGTTDTNLTAIAAAVIGGTCLFGGRGSAYSAMLGIVVLQAIQSGLNLIGVDSSVRFMVTGAVLLLAVAIDSVSRGPARRSGRG